MLCKKDFKITVRFPRSYAPLILATLLPLTGWLPVHANEPWLVESEVSERIRQYKSRSFTLHTDLDEEQAGRMLDRMERALKTCANYWGQKFHGRVQAYVVSDLGHWRAEDFPHPWGRILIHRVGGAVDVRNIREGRRTIRQCTLYAAATPGIAEHEVVHAFCSQVFGTSGPGWYREGMAELSNNRDSSKAIQCPVEILSELRHGTPRRISTITQDATMADSIFAMLNEIGKRRKSGLRPTRAEKRDLELGKAVHDTRRTYCWCWSLCHFLETSPNYSQRFLALGKAYLSRQPVQFDHFFGGMADELRFEYEQFLRHIDNGYRVDLCSWKWGVDCDTLSHHETLRVRVRADYGYQPTRLMVVAGQQYQFEAAGTWCLQPGQKPVSADGDGRHHGHLEAVVFASFQLSEPIRLGQTGDFTAPADGQLYLRCHDHWNALSDNQGALQVSFSRKNAN